MTAPATAVYLDYNATAPVRPEVAAAVAEALRRGGNPSSVHAAGRNARAAVEAAREQVAALVNAPRDGVIFTAGGTEAAHLALQGVARANGVTDLIVSAVEHGAVGAAAHYSGFKVRELPVDREGVADLGALERHLAGITRSGGRALVALMLANNETGVIQPVTEAARLVHEAGGLLYTDAVQGPGKYPVDMAALDADMLSLSAHKLGGPQGTGALIIREGLAVEPLLRGGGQELNRRAGTENVPGIVGFGAAAALAAADNEAVAHMQNLRDRLEARMAEAVPEVAFFGRGAPRLPNTICAAVPGVSAETLVMALDLEGVAVSSGAACSSGKVTPSHVLAAMGVEETLTRAAIRVSLGWASREEDIEHFLPAWTAHIERAGKRTRETESLEA
ncbi:MAG: cysteine desulfurase family protein [Alphaproteobacteria bacterium]